MADELKPAVETTPPTPTEVLPTTVAHVEPVVAPVVPVEPTEAEVRMTKMEETMNTMVTQVSTIVAALQPKEETAPVAPNGNEVITEESVRQAFYTDPVKAMDDHQELRLKPFMDKYTATETTRITRDIGIAEQSIANLPRAAELLPQIRESLKDLAPAHRADPETVLSAYHMRLGAAVSAEANKGIPTTLPTSEVHVTQPTDTPSDSEVSMARKLGISPEAYARGKGLPSSEKVLGSLLTGVK